MSEPICEHFPDGIPELGIPQGAHVFLWIAEQRYAYYVERNEYDHGVIFNHMMQDRSISLLPGPGLIEHLRVAMEAGRLASRPPASALSPKPAPSHLRLVRPE